MMEPTKTYRAILSANKAKLKRARALFARLTFWKVIAHPDPRIASWDTAELAKQAGLYSQNTVTTDIACNLQRKWYYLFGGGDANRRNYSGYYLFLEDHGLDHRMKPREVKQWRAKLNERLREKPMGETTPTPHKSLPLTPLVGSTEMVISTLTINAIMKEWLDRMIAGGPHEVTSFDKSSKSYGNEFVVKFKTGEAQQ